MTEASTSSAKPTFPADDAEARRVGEGLLDGTWPAAEWRHAHHCVATAYLILCRPEIDLDRELPDIIRRYNVAQGGENTETAGYHHTITCFYLQEIRRFLHEAPRLGLAEACRELLASPIGDKDYPLRFYPREVLFSREARRAWVPPPAPTPAAPSEHPLP